MDDWLPADHLARFVADLVDEHLDLSAIHAAYGEGRGAPPHDPRLMVRILLFGHTTGVRSSRTLEAACTDVVAFRWLAAGAGPDYRSIARFRKRHLSALGHLFVQALALCQATGMVRLGRVALDGTKVRANASRRKATSYARMSEKEKILAAQVSGLLAEAEAVDAAEDAAFGKNNSGPGLPAELARRESRLAKIAEAVAKAAPAPKAQRNFTDPDSKIMTMPDGAFHQCFNAQAVVDGTHQVIVATELTDNAADVGNLIPITEQATANTGHAPGQVLADAGYCSEGNLTEAASVSDQTGTEFYVATGRAKHDDPAPVAPRGPIPRGATAKHILLRGLDAASGERLLLAACHNLRKLHGHIEAGGLRALATT